MLAASIPTFWLGLYLIMIFSVYLGWFPSSGFPSLSDEGGLSNLRYLLLPSLTLAAPNAALIVRLVRASMLDVAREDHVRTARAKGLHPSRVAIKHIFRNALISVAAAFGFTFAALISEAVVTETVFLASRHWKIGRTINLTPRLPRHPRRDPHNCSPLYGH